MEKQKLNFENLLNALYGNDSNGSTKDFPQYDTPEQIKQCLNCQKEECNNCLKHVNFI